MKNSLIKYNSKRDFKVSSEPKGIKQKSKKKLKFVLQHHIARKDHYDFRLEFDGVLKSWAVPKGPSYNSKDKRLAILVEDHPVSYRNFEGVIQKGEYGAGTVMIVDTGYYEIIGDFKKSFKEGVLKFRIFGKRLKGLWSLIHYENDNWLLIKDKDDYNLFLDITKIDTSIKTCRTMSEIEIGIKNEINITNPDKVIYKRPKITKLDVVNYYKSISKRMLPYIENRIISVVRCPNGVDEESFFKKHLEKNRIGIGSIKIKSKSDKKDDYYYIINEDGLISEVQMNTIEFHIWGSKINNIDRPNIMVFDLDPDEELSLKKLRTGVKDLKSILDELDLKSYLKTSGGKGYHILVPIKDVTWNKFRNIAKNIALLMESKWPDKYTTNIRKDKRKNKIFIDWVRNTKGATSIAPYSLRARKNAPVSMPIRWNELDKIKPNQIKMKDAIDRIKLSDPWKDFFEN